MIKYRAWPAILEIKPVEILRETDKMVVIASPDCIFYKNGERRELKETENYAYFDTFREAKDFLIDQEEDAIVGHLNDVKRHQEKLKKIEEMQEPHA